MICGVYTAAVIYYIYNCLYSTTTTKSTLPMSRPTSFDAKRHGPARVHLVLKRAEEWSTVSMRYFFPPEIPSAYQVKVGLAMWYCCMFLMVPRRVPLRADSSACADLLLAAGTSFHSASWPLCKLLIKDLAPRCGRTEDISATQAAFPFYPGSVRTEPPVIAS